jgi:antirestriction protein ArdC
MTKSANTDATAITRDLYQEVTNRIIALIEQGVAPWRQTWNSYGLARNYATGHIYTGINYLLMNNTGYSIPYFMTFNQVQEQGGQVRKGAKAEMVIYFKVFYKDVNDQTLTKDESIMRTRNGEEIRMLKFIRYYNVFNIGDIEGIEFNIQEISLKPKEKIERCEHLVENMPNKPGTITVPGDSACYYPANDFINIPAMKQFDSTEHYYATLFHELVHATGHTSRLARLEVMHPELYRDKQYAREELIAEMGASFLCSTVHIDYDDIVESSAAYLDGWLKVLKEDSKFIFKVASEAQRAADYILNKGKLNE